MPNIIAIIQARTGSTRLPGKVMYPLNGKPVLAHVVTRTAHADSVDHVVVATSTEPTDDVIEQYAPSFGADVVRGSESNVLERFKKTIELHDPDLIVRVTGDNPLILPEFIDTCVDRFRTKDIDYVSDRLKRTFPLGTTCEVFTTNSFKDVLNGSNTPEQHEHVTPYYKQYPEKFKIEYVTSSQIFDKNIYQNRTNLRLTLDKPADYKLFKQLYDEIPYQTILNIRDVIDHIDRNRVHKINSHIKQKEI